jgi:ankyrin repeat protein
MVKSPVRKRAHPVRGKDGSPPAFSQFDFTNLLSAHKCGHRAYERKFVMPVKRLPSNPNLNHLKYQAKDLLRDHAAHKLDAAQRLREFHPLFPEASDAAIFAAKLTLSGAQLAIARERGFPSWARLKRHIENPTVSDQLNLPHHGRIEDAPFRGKVEIVRLSLDAGEDPNRFNPAGGHSHCTPLHQAAGIGNRELVQLLLERGANLDVKDILWQATSADWANHAGFTELEAYLRSQATMAKKQN